MHRWQCAQTKRLCSHAPLAVRPNKAVLFPRTALTNYQPKPTEFGAGGPFHRLAGGQRVSLRRSGASAPAGQARIGRSSPVEILGGGDRRVVQPLIDAAIGAERLNASLAQEKLESLVSQSRWIAVFASSLAALFSLTSGILLLRGFRNPVEALMQGTDAIASGNLAHRIELPRQDEFGYLATHFNHMSVELDRQLARLK